MRISIIAQKDKSMSNPILCDGTPYYMFLTFMVKSSVIEALLSIWPQVPPELALASLSTLFSHFIFLSSPDPPCPAHLPSGSFHILCGLSLHCLINSSHLHRLFQILPFQETLELLKIQVFHWESRTLDSSTYCLIFVLCLITRTFLQLNETPFRKSHFLLSLWSQYLAYCLAQGGGFVGWMSLGTRLQRIHVH